MAPRGKPYRRIGRVWTPEEDKALAELYYSVGYTRLASRFKVSPASVRSRAKKLGITKHGAPRTRKPKEAPPAPIPQVVSPAAARLAQFDPAVARAVHEKTLGLPAGALINRAIPL